MRFYYWVLAKEDEATIAITPIKTVAEWIAENYEMPCIIRVEERR